MWYEFWFVVVGYWFVGFVVGCYCGVGGGGVFVLVGCCVCGGYFVVVVWCWCGGCVIGVWCCLVVGICV